MIPDTATRASSHSPSEVNAWIREEMNARLQALENNDRDALIDQRLHELEREWDVERSLQSNFAIVSLVALALTAGNKRWSALALAVPAFMIQHALQGWCPPLSVLRRFGFRTAREISDERFALKAMRGDFDEAVHSRNAQAIAKASRRK